jgi:hypothetical protein
VQNRAQVMFKCEWKCENKQLKKWKPVKYHRNKWINRENKFNMQILKNRSCDSTNWTMIYNTGKGEYKKTKLIHQHIKYMELQKIKFHLA